ncbi:MAG: prepilin-type N-terminal cleavage/methylation domain-containing protein [Verrucomicrobiia bacterium]
MKRFINNFRSRRLLASPRCDAPVRHSLALRDEGGFTLIEVMIAVAVVTMGIVAVLGLIPVSLKSARDAKDNTLAAIIVQDVFTIVRSRFRTYNDATLPNIPETVYFDSDSNPVGAAGVNSYFQVNLTYQQTIPGLDLYRVTAVVTWPAHSLVTASTLPGNTFVTEVAKLRP